MSMCKVHRLCDCDFVGVHSAMSFVSCIKVSAAWPIITKHNCVGHSCIMLSHPSHQITVCMQVLTMVTLSFTFAGALAGLMGMNLYFAVAETPLVSSNPDPKHHLYSRMHGASVWACGRNLQLAHDVPPVQLAHPKPQKILLHFWVVA